MIACLNSKQILAKDGKPVHGRFFVFQKDTNQKATVYTYDTENTLVEAQNPIYTNDFGFPEYEVILDDQIFSIVVEKYIGDYDDPKADERESSWELVNSYYEGNVDTSETSAELVYGSSSLADADIAQGSVDVIGYWNSFDCGRRTYVWDPLSVDTADNGYVYKSNQDSKGRWILQSDLPYIPSEYYGVYPGKLANMERLTSCPNTVGSSVVVNVPSCIKFATGTYDLTSSIHTNTNGRNRSILIDNKTCFGNKWEVWCEGIIVLGEIRKDDDEYVGKLHLPACCPAKYSWFPSLDSFLDCAQTGSEVLIVDSYGIDNELTKDHTLSYKIFKFEGGRLLWSGNHSFVLDSCKVYGEVMKAVDATNPNKYSTWNGFYWKTKFKNMEVSDKYILEESFKPTCENCTYELAHFKSTATYLNYMLAANKTEIDLAGGFIETFVISSKDSVTLINANFTNLSTYNVKSLTLRNSQIGRLNTGYGMNYLYIYHTNVDAFEQYGEYNLFEIDHGRFLAAWPGLKAKKASAVNSLINSHLEFSEEGTIYNSFVSSVYGGKIYLSNSIFTSSVEAYEIHAENCTFKCEVWPKAKQYDGEWKIKARIGNCTFCDRANGGTCRGIVLKREGTESQVVLDAFDVTGCSFLQTGTTIANKSYVDGIVLEVFGGQEERFLHDDVTRHKWAWEGNSGNCLQIYLKTNKTIATDTKYMEDLRFIGFGINGVQIGSTRRVVPYDVLLSPISKTTGEVATKKYRCTSGNFDYSKFYISQYKTSDYFCFKVVNENFTANSYMVEIIPCRRYGESDVMT